MTEESSPDEYFCEKCRKDLHKIHVASNGYVRRLYSAFLDWMPVGRRLGLARRAIRLGGLGLPRPSLSLVLLAIAAGRPGVLTLIPCSQRYSSYLPLNRHSRTTSRATSLAKETGSRNRKTSPNSAAKAAAASAKTGRRSTLNSREAGYDEDELLRRAIEASKEDAPPDQEGAAKRHKRGRSESEE
jgi:hypothetical protein